MKSPRLLLVAGDVLVLLVFAVAGRRTHAEAAGLAAALEVATTAAPFVVGWLVASLGPWTRAIVPHESRALLLEAVRAWAVAFPIAILVRALILGRLSPLSFYIVACVAALSMVLVWRIVFSLVTSVRRTAA